MILETIEPYLESINLVFAVILVLLGIMVSFNLKGALKRTWNYFLLGIFLFGVHEVVGSLEEFGIFQIEGLYALTEFIYVLALALATWTFRKVLVETSKIKGKKR